MVAMEGSSNKKTKILFYMYYLNGGGAERTIINIINNLDREKFEVLLVLGSSGEHHYLETISTDVKITYLKCSRIRNSILGLRKVIISENPDILFSTLNLNNISLLISKMMTFKKIPTIIREANNRTESGEVTSLNKIITRLLYNTQAAKVIALSEGVKTDLVNNFKIKENKIKVIYNPVDVDKIKKLSIEEITDFNKPETDTIISVGRLEKQKDYFTLINAFNKLLETRDANLFILGKGSLEQKLKKYCIEKNIQDKVKFLGFKQNPYKYIAKADLFVLSSKWEGFGHVIVEAMTCGTPVIATNCKSGPAEIIGNNEYGLLVPVEDSQTMSEKMKLVLESKVTSENYRNKGLERSQYFRANRIVVEYETVFMEHSKTD